MKYELTDLNFIYKYFLMHIQLPVHFFFLSSSDYKIHVICLDFGIL